MLNCTIVLIADDYVCHMIINFILGKITKTQNDHPMDFRQQQFSKHDHPLGWLPVRADGTDYNHY